MTVIAYVPPLDQHILVYERPIGNSSAYGVNYPVHYRLASDPRSFDAAEPVPVLVTINGTQVAPNASPYVVWSPAGGPQGTIIVSDADHSAVYVNRAGGDPDKWELKESGQPAAYSRALHVIEKNPDRLMVIGGDTFDGNGWGGVSLSVVEVEELLRGIKKP
ncbi:hypothetical protein VTK56DRAFT_7373 [Thermocarpiscus australiensis]